MYPIFQVAILSSLAVLISVSSQATLAPIYSSLPAAAHQSSTIAASFLVGIFARRRCKTSRSGQVLRILGVAAFWVPVVQTFLFRQSAILGVVAGPAVTGLVNAQCIIAGVAYAIAETLEGVRLEPRLPTYISAWLPTLLLTGLVLAVSRFFPTLLPGLGGIIGASSPVRTQLFTAAVLTCLAPSRLAVLSLPAIVHALVANPHCDTAYTTTVLNQQLHKHNWTLLDRRWSTTGYLSVLEDQAADMRVLRCDHSLLGGEWLLTDDRKRHGWTTSETILTVFQVLEAVRLMETNHLVSDTDAHALVIGLGIGTAPRALLAHGINTTTVELDPAVHALATTHFGFPAAPPPILQDARAWVAAAAARPAPPRYDYILHDVFTSGTEPLGLFTRGFLTQLRALRAPHGVVALNYAGDLAAPLTRTVLNTIDHVFDGRRCRIFRDARPREMGPDEPLPALTNLVVLCRADAGPVTFRRPMAADCLGSRSRREYMYPDARDEVPFPLQGVRDRARRAAEAALEDGREGEWTAERERMARQHWELMRKIVPDAVWELW